MASLSQFLISSSRHYFPIAGSFLRRNPNLVFGFFPSVSCRHFAAEAAGACEDFVRGKVFSNGVAIITLDRPKALNAMNLDMDLKYKKFLDEWENNPNVKCVLVESSSPRAFSAGGDVKQIATKYSMTEIREVFAAEYSLICKISSYKKPYVSFMDGVTMGFGIGLSCHGQYRVITERTVFAMPENGIGLFPDVGFSYISANGPGGGAVGAYLGLTGKRISSPDDALYIGLGTHYIPSRSLALLKEDLLHETFSDDVYKDVESLLTRYKKEPESNAQLKMLLPHIISSFSGLRSVSEIMEELKGCQTSSDSVVSEWANDALLGLSKGAPFSLCITQKHFSQVALANGNSEHELSKLSGVMKTEFRMAVRTSIRKDFSEGVRAVLVDRDQNPTWNPARVEDVNMTEVEAVFDPLPAAEELEICRDALCR